MSGPPEPNLLYELERFKRTAEWKVQFREFCEKQEAMGRKHNEELANSHLQPILNRLTPRTPKVRKPRLIPKLRILPKPRVSLPRASKRSNPGSSTQSENDFEMKDESDEEEEPPLKRRRKMATSFTSYHAPPSPSLITQSMLSMIAVRVSDKVYSQIGSTCHQCRQKTLDTKTVCRSGRCVGVRGSFCQICLHNRYGENVAAALLDENWQCPDCRGICNASICRRRLGLPPTGPLYPHIGSHNSVRDYLKASGEEEGHMADKSDDEGDAMEKEGNCDGISKDGGSQVEKDKHEQSGMKKESKNGNVLGMEISSEYGGHETEVGTDDDEDAGSTDMKESGYGGGSTGTKSSDEDSNIELTNWKYWPVEF